MIAHDAMMTPINLKNLLLKWHLLEIVNNTRYSIKKKTTLAVSDLKPPANEEIMKATDNSKIPTKRDLEFGFLSIISIVPHIKRLIKSNRYIHLEKYPSKGIKDHNGLSLQAGNNAKKRLNIKRDSSKNLRHEDGENIK